MKNPFLKQPLLVLAVGIATSTVTQAIVTINYVTVGYPGNAADANSITPNFPAGVGAVAYVYQIGKYEVTNAEYTEFLNAVDPTGANANGIWNASMDSDIRGGISQNLSAPNGAKYSVKTDMGNKPVNYVSWYDAARFTNWLQNGQGSGSTETGAYTLSGSSGFIPKNAGATAWVTSADEWYKAACYDPTPGASVDNYWMYSTQSDTVPIQAVANATGDISNPGANVVNYNRGADWNGQDGNLTTVGSAGANNYFGTADQSGNVLEWLSPGHQPRGGYWGSISHTRLMPRNNFIDLPNQPWVENVLYGFRVASLPPQNLLAINSVTQMELNSSTTKVTFTVSLQDAATAPVTVTWATANGTATAPSDYVANSGVLSFATGQKSKTIVVKVKGNTLLEPNEDFHVNLSNPTGASILVGQGTCTIINDD